MEVVSDPSRKLSGVVSCAMCRFSPTCNYNESGIREGDRSGDRYFLDSCFVGLMEVHPRKGKNRGVGLFKIPDEVIE